MTFPFEAARYRGCCPACDEPIRPGDRATFDKGELVHAGCAAWLSGARQLGDAQPAKRGEPGRDRKMAQAVLREGMARSECWCGEPRGHGGWPVCAAREVARRESADAEEGQP